MTTVNPFTQPSINLKVKIIELPQRTDLCRVHLKKYKADQFNNSGSGNARFSPIFDSKGSIIPTIYAADTLAAALMETVFHDVPTYQGMKTLDGSRYVDPFAHCQLSTIHSMKIAVLFGPGLKGLGIKEGELIHSAAADYEETRKWAMAIHEQYPAVQGLVWISKQCSPQKAYIFFEDRCISPIFNVLYANPDLNNPHCNSVIDELTADMDLTIL